MRARCERQRHARGRAGWRDHPLLLDVVAAAPALLEALPVAAAGRLSRVCREARDLIAADAVFWASARARACTRRGAPGRRTASRCCARCAEGALPGVRLARDEAQLVLRRARRRRVLHVLRRRRARVPRPVRARGRRGVGATRVGGRDAGEPPRAARRPAGGGQAGAERAAVRRRAEDDGEPPPLLDPPGDLRPRRHPPRGGGVPREGREAAQGARRGGAVREAVVSGGGRRVGGRIRVGEGEQSRLACAGRGGGKGRASFEGVGGESGKKIHQGRETLLATQDRPRPVVLPYSAFVRLRTNVSPLSIMNSDWEARRVALSLSQPKYGSAFRELDFLTMSLGNAAELYKRMVHQDDAPLLVRLIADKMLHGKSIRQRHNILAKEWIPYFFLAWNENEVHLARYSVQEEVEQIGEDKKFVWTVSIRKCSDDLLLFMTAYTSVIRAPRSLSLLLLSLLKIEHYCSVFWDKNQNKQTKQEVKHWQILTGN